MLPSGDESATTPGTFSKGDVAVTSIPEMTRIETLTVGLITSHQKHREATLKWCDIDSSKLKQRLILKFQARKDFILSV